MKRDTYERGLRLLADHANGMTYKQIGLREDMHEGSVYRLIAAVNIAAGLGVNIKEPAPEKPRPAWSIPSEALLAECKIGKAEIAYNLARGLRRVGK